MSQTVADLPSFLQHADRRMKDTVLAALLAERMTTTPGEPLDVPGVGVVVPFAPFGGSPPDLSPEEEAEIERRMATLDDSLLLSDFIDRLADPAAVPVAGREQ